MEIILAYVAGLLTLINPCVLPVLPLVLGAAVQSNRHAPLALAAGMGVAFVTLGFIVAVFGRSIGLTAEGLAQVGALMMVGFGIVLVVPRLAHGFEMATAGFAARADKRLDGIGNSGLAGSGLAGSGLAGSSLAGHFLGGALLGAVWSPCVGPTLGGAIALAARGQNLASAALIMTAFAFGIGTIIVALGYGTRNLIRQRQAGLRRLAVIARPLMGILFIAVGLAILTGLTRIIESRLLDILPYWLQDISVAI